ncbi:glycosylphosphatidylinositol-anchored high density lipoprotein-binding protein 1-like [Portunus trituberculatus]|uniref:glycosylphosphatidylinositol-anchored high density lipoprotein-binding protein 1-like n=1 Tax=Portunus trituberculatus TaxID=210409 RepID=UPI001E1D0607|nr:glycosylphosphatidylinositol-anchored high density lipoprotein-binding protein 1-like [Portunus trituberculatus]
MRTILLLVVVVMFLGGPLSVAGNSLRCYTCVSMPNDLTCMNDPDSVTSSVPITDCDMDGEVCCTITRINFLEDETKLQSFSRGCTDKCPKKSFEKVEDATYVTYNTVCKTPECNVGPGDKPLTGSGGSQDAKSNEIWGIQGLPSGANALSASLLLLTVLPLLLLRQN